MSLVFLEVQADYHNEEVEIGDGIFADVVFTVTFQASGEDPRESFDLDITSLEEIGVKHVTGPDGDYLPVTEATLNTLKDKFWLSLRSEAEDELFRKVAQGKFDRHPLI